MLRSKHEYMNEYMHECMHEYMHECMHECMHDAGGKGLNDYSGMQIIWKVTFQL